jgi:hypothetical protein
MDQIPSAGRAAETRCADLLLSAGIGHWVGGAPGQDQSLRHLEGWEPGMEVVEPVPDHGGFDAAGLGAEVLMDIPPSDVSPLNPSVDAGKAGAIQTACRWREAGDALLLVMDDRAGRMAAKSRGIVLIGSAAAIGLARMEGLVPAARPLLDRLVDSGYFIGPSFVPAVLNEVGE